MLGRNHLIAGTALAVGDIAVLQGLSKIDSWQVPEQMNMLQPIVTWIVERIHLWSGAAIEWLMPQGFVWWWIALALIFFWFGSLLPDIDHPSSTLGRYNKIPLGPHHGITHSDWIVLGLLAISLLPLPGIRLLFFLTLGYFIHLELDGWSLAGRVRFWPLGSYKTIERNGQEIVVVKHPRPVYYTVGHFGEYVLVGLCLIFGVLSVFWDLTIQ